MESQDLFWSSWGIASVEVRATDALGSIAASKLNTTFTYTMSLGLTVYALSVEVVHVDLTTIGSVVGRPSLRTDLTVDLRPHALVLAAAPEVRHNGATFSWSGTLDADFDHLELLVRGGDLNASFALDPNSVSASVPLAPSTDYLAWIVAIDGSGQGTPSNVVAFQTPADSSATDPAAPLGVGGTPILFWTLIIVAGLLGAIGYWIGRIRGRRET